MLTPETLDRLEAQARAQQGREIGTGVFIMPGELLALIEYARNPLMVVDYDAAGIQRVQDIPHPPPGATAAATVVEA